MRLILALGAALALAACAGYSGHGLVPGQSNADEVEALMGPSAERRPGPGGETVRYYSRQPNGRQMYAARFGPDGKLVAIEQRLTEANVAWLMPGAWRAENVRDLFGPPYDVHIMPRLAREVWTYKMYGDGFMPKNLYVQMSNDGVVREVMVLDDPQFASKGDGFRH
jgi:hypothetical protein